MSKLLGGCNEARAHFGVECKCCGTCHYISPNGYYQGLDDLTLPNDDYFDTCCVVRLACKDKEAERE